MGVRMLKRDFSGERIPSYFLLVAHIPCHIQAQLNKLKKKTKNRQRKSEPKRLPQQEISQTRGKGGPPRKQIAWWLLKF